jgi:hypothetical protein
MLNRFKLWLPQQFSMKDLGEAHFILGIQITRDRANRTLTISQQHHVEFIVARYRMDESRPVSTPMECGIHFLQSDCPSTVIPHKRRRTKCAMFPISQRWGRSCMQCWQLVPMSPTQSPVSASSARVTGRSIGLHSSVYSDTCMAQLITASRMVA